MKAVHYLKVARNFWPWDRAFWIALLHDGIEDGWLSAKAVVHLPRSVIGPVMILTRCPGESYAKYIERIAEAGGVTHRVKEADLIENYKRAPPSLRSDYVRKDPPCQSTRHPKKKAIIGLSWFTPTRCQKARIGRHKAGK